MEDVYTIKVKTKPDPRNLYPSERRYSASTVCGLAWVHIFLAIISLILTLLTIIIPDNENSVFLNSTVFENFTNENEYSDKSNDNSYLLVLPPSLVTVFGLTAGLTAILASVRWYVDRNITWLFISSVISSFVCFAAVFMILTWILTENTHSRVNELEDVFVLRHTDILDQNETHFVIYRNATEEHTNLFTDKVLSINILISTLLELFLSILSVKIAYKGMRNSYNTEEKRGNCVQVITTIKGDGKINPNRKLKKIFLAQSDNGFYLRNETKNKETNSQFQKERMINFLNCSFEGESNPEHTPSVQSEVNSTPHLTPNKRITPLSWGDSLDHTIYNQNTLNFERIFNFCTDEKVDKE